MRLIDTVSMHSVGSEMDTTIQFPVGRPSSKALGGWTVGEGNSDRMAVHSLLFCTCIFGARKREVEITQIFLSQPQLHVVARDCSRF